MSNLEDRIRASQQVLLEKGAAQGAIRTVLSPYRINPLGAHVDHQGGDVLAQPIDQYTILSFTTAACKPGQPHFHVTSMQEGWRNNPCELQITGGDLVRLNDNAENWTRYLVAAIEAFAAHFEVQKSLVASVDGTLIGAGLSSSASVILAYLRALEECCSEKLSAQQQVELCRVVENEHMGLNNGVQDQMSIVFGSKEGLTTLDVNSVTASLSPSPPSAGNVCWLLLYSGYSRELINSGFNQRVAECKEAAALLEPGSGRLGDVAEQFVTEKNFSKLPRHLARRAKHFFSETARVRQGALDWNKGSWEAFGELMNASCKSSINDYESGSDALVDAHIIASQTAGVFGSRFGGGGYGGCLIMLVDRRSVDAVSQSVFQQYLDKYPDRKGIARIVVAEPSDGLAIVQSTQV